ncbi:TerB family tellurite resistance protein [Pseudenhygromyxa sp. WMMC2535]|uniref:TerB family tellurite resistance protein n=1 Tax=Pseudenhygromyxa sp. WMMC2535 TaxID=2712867 RepID=UPI0015517EE6|nr:TerB family tellurite resistance protein [Pseudenhygromyxa sp. WMMC2535]NVB41592.1 TerB family tellurite resistance protein [Pseudenhygromyxa sp. WMMC2535]
MNEHVETITDLLLGAAYADKRLEGQEKQKIRELLLKLIGAEALPEAIESRFKSFSPAAFDVAAAGQRLADLGPERRKVLEMVAAVSESDEEIDLAEDRYLRKVGEAMGLADKQFRDLVVDFQELDDLEGILSETLGI